jgi:hypothetical protein
VAELKKLLLIAAALVGIICALQSAWASEPPGDLCSLLPAAELSKTLGQPYDPPQKSIAPRLKGKIRVFVQVDDFTAAMEKPLENLASRIAGQL